MTNETLNTEESSSARFFRRVSSVISSPSNEHRFENNHVANVKRSRPSEFVLTRQVSNEGLLAIVPVDDIGKKPAAQGREASICPLEFDKSVIASSTRSPLDDNEARTSRIASDDSCATSLRNGLLNLHVASLRLEGQLHPLRLILSRLMSHPTFNRKGVFNAPVDPVTLCLPDYFKIITRPMDLGSVKVKLHALNYSSPHDVVDDIRLVFDNAMKYNPPPNPVHIAASQMLGFFEEQLQAFLPDYCTRANCTLEGEVSTKDSTGSAKSRTVSPKANFAEHAPAWLSPTHLSETEMNRAPFDSFDLADVLLSRKRKKRGSKVIVGHNCQWCEGRTCSICHQGCLHLEPALLLCNGASCAGSRIRKNAVYFVAPDGSRVYCQRCYAGVPALLPTSGPDDISRYKRDLLKRKNDEEVVERWLTCSNCKDAVHQVCALFNEFRHSADAYLCPSCAPDCRSLPILESDHFAFSCPTAYTFITGSDVPVPLANVSGVCPSQGDCNTLNADTLPEDAISTFIQHKVRNLLAQESIPNVDKTVLVRVISDCHRVFKVPDVVRKHFRMAVAADEASEGSKHITPPMKANYRSKAIALFQKIDGLDVCIFCMYVHEYDGDEEYDNREHQNRVARSKRVYIAYLDSVEHFRPRTCRTQVYHEVLVAYLATARKREYDAAYIWACPPLRGNSFVFWNHPSYQKTPTLERLVAWYHGALSRAVDCGVVTDVRSLYETNFEQFMERFVDDAGESNETSDLPRQLECPPLLEGDYWIEEASRIHSAIFARQMKVGPSTKVSTCGFFDNFDRCPASQVAALLRDMIMAHPCCEPFCRPVNAAAMKLKDYHKIVSKPMDLGTIYAHCVLGEYEQLIDLARDVELVVANAKRFNPVGNFVHTKADEMEELFFSELGKLTAAWAKLLGRSDDTCWRDLADTKLCLNYLLPSIIADVSFDEITMASSSATESLDSRSRSEVSKDLTCDTACSEVGSGLCKLDVDLVGAGPEAVMHRMVGNDRWLLDKRNSQSPSKAGSSSKKAVGRKRKSCADSLEDSAPKRRRQSWLGEEIGNSVRRARTSVFACTLRSDSSCSELERSAESSFDTYAKSFDAMAALEMKCRRSGIADARHGLLEFSQYRNLEFDTLRHAKYSTSIFLFHLHKKEAPGTVPTCSECGKEISDVRWHKVSRIIEKCHGRKASDDFEPLELCTSCYSNKKQVVQFVPLQVSLRSSDDA